MPEVSQREPGSAHGFEFQGTSRDEGRDFRKGREMRV